MKKLLSYIIPLDIKRYHTDKNGVLEVSLIDGKKRLNSLHANYSYGTLQSVLKLGLQQINLSGVRNVLLLGLGGGSAVQTLRDDFGFQGPVVGVDIDEVVVDIARNEFDMKNDPELSIVLDDACYYVRNTNEVFDLIIVDVFLDDKVPAAIYGWSFWKNIDARLHPGGYFLFNASIGPFRKNVFRGIGGCLAEKYRLRACQYVLGTNHLLIGEKIKTSM
ncbi:MAG: fused MFS/spermidine synthase [Marinilabilia sp.]